MQKCHTNWINRDIWNRQLDGGSNNWRAGDRRSICLGGNKWAGRSTASVGCNRFAGQAVDSRSLFRTDAGSTETNRWVRSSRGPIRKTNPNHSQCLAPPRLLRSTPLTRGPSQFRMTILIGFYCWMKRLRITKRSDTILRRRSIFLWCMNYSCRLY